MCNCNPCRLPKSIEDDALETRNHEVIKKAMMMIAPEGEIWVPPPPSASESVKRLDAFIEKILKPQVVKHYFGDGKKEGGE